jgi:hypothetical protein
LFSGNKFKNKIEIIRRPRTTSNLLYFRQSSLAMKQAHSFSDRALFELVNKKKCKKKKKKKKNRINTFSRRFIHSIVESICHTISKERWSNSFSFVFRLIKNSHLFLSFSFSPNPDKLPKFLAPLESNSHSEKNCDIQLLASAVGI